MKRFSAALFLILLSLNCLADQTAVKTPDYLLEIKPDKKILHVERLDLATDIPIYQILDYFPELLAREGDVTLSNYDLKVNDVSVTIDAGVILNQLYISEVAKIEVSESPAKSQQVNGEGGVINVILKKLDEGLSGRAAVEAGSMFDIAPLVKFNYNHGKFNLRTTLAFEHYNPHNNTYQLDRVSDLSTTHLLDTTSLHTTEQMLRMHLEYDPDTKNHIEAWIAQGYRIERTHTDYRYDTGIAQFQYRAYDDINKQDFDFAVNTMYKHKFETSAIEASLSYSYNNFNNTRYDKSSSAYKGHNSYNLIGKHNISGYAKYEWQVIPVTDKSQFTLKPGVNFSFKPNESYDFDEGINEENLYSKGQEIFVSPYLQADLRLGPVFLTGGINYQYQNTHTDMNGFDDDVQNNHDWTGNIDVGWQIVPHHYLSAIYERALRRPSSMQLYPTMYYSPKDYSYILGNPSLKSETFRNVSLNYIYDFHKDIHNVIVNLGLQYLHTDNIISRVTILSPTLTPSSYFTYENNGVSDIFNANAMLNYSVGIFTGNLTGNIFRNWSYVDDKDDVYFYYNISFVPSFSLPKNWRIFAKICYYSPVETIKSVVSDYLYARLNLSKSVKNWTFTLYASDIFHKYVKDTIREPNYTEVKSYNLKTQDFGGAVTVSF